MSDPLFYFTWYGLWMTGYTLCAPLSYIRWLVIMITVLVYMIAASRAFSNDFFAIWTYTNATLCFLLKRPLLALGLQTIANIYINAAWTGYNIINCCANALFLIGIVCLQKPSRLAWTACSIATGIVYFVDLPRITAWIVLVNLAPLYMDEEVWLSMRLRVDSSFWLAFWALPALSTPTFNATLFPQLFIVDIRVPQTPILEMSNYLFAPLALVSTFSMFIFPRPKKGLDSLL